MPHLLSVGMIMGDIYTAKVKKSLVYAVFFHVWGKSAHNAHNTLAKVAVQRIVTAKHLYIVLFQLFAYLEFRSAHGYAQRLGFFTARYNTAVVVRQYHNRFTHPLRLENPLTGGIKIIAVNQGIHAAKLHI